MSGFLSGKSSLSVVTANDIADDAVGADAIADDAIVQAAIADNIVNEVRLQVSNTPTNGYFLSAQSGNTGGLTWAEAGGGGKILQVVTAFDDDYASHSNTTIDAPVEIISAAITCAATSSKVLMFGQSSGSTTASNYQMLGTILKRGSTVIGSADNSSWNTGVGEAHSLMNAQNYSKTASWSFHFLDSPSSTSELTYKVFNFAHHHNGTASSNLTFIKNGGGYNYGTKESIQGVTSITLMEIGA